MGISLRRSRKACDSGAMCNWILKMSNFIKWKCYGCMIQVNLGEDLGRYGQSKV